MYSVIVFDLGNVLIPFDYSRVIKYFNRLKPGVGDKFARMYEENYYIHKDFERGRITREKFLTVMTGWVENVVSPEQFCKIYSDVFTLNQNVIDLLPNLKKNYKLCLLSNTNEIHEQYGYSHYEFLKTFDKLFLSHKIGAVKPEKEIYKAVEAYTQKPPSEHLFIDDILEYVEGAKNCGWDAIQFKEFENLVAELNMRGLIFH